MKYIVATAFVCLVALNAPPMAANAEDKGSAYCNRVSLVYRWREIDERTIHVWLSASRPFKVTFAERCDLRWAHFIGIRNRPGGRMCLVVGDEVDSHLKDHVCRIARVEPINADGSPRAEEPSWW